MYVSRPQVHVNPFNAHFIFIYQHDPICDFILYPCFFLVIKTIEINWKTLPALSDGKKLQHILYKRDCRHYRQCWPNDAFP